MDKKIMTFREWLDSKHLPGWPAGEHFRAFLYAQYQQETGCTHEDDGRESPVSPSKKPRTDEEEIARIPSVVTILAPRWNGHKEQGWVMIDGKEICVGSSITFEGALRLATEYTIAYYQSKLCGGKSPALQRRPECSP